VCGPAPCVHPSAPSWAIETLLGRRNSFYWVGPLEHTGPGLSGVVCDRASLVRRSSHSATAPRSPPPPRPVRSQGSLPATAPCPNLHRRGGVLQSGRLDSSPSLSLALGLSLCCGGRSDSSTRSANQLSAGRGRTQGLARGLSGEKVESAVRTVAVFLVGRWGSGERWLRRGRGRRRRWAPYSRRRRRRGPWRGCPSPSLAATPSSGASRASSPTTRPSSPSSTGSPTNSLTKSWSFPFLSQV